jgi:hypothetical protein
MKLPRLTIREKALVSANIALGLALAIDRHRAGGLAVAVELGDREIHLAEQTIDQLRMELAECGENLERADAELRVRESADRGRAGGHSATGSTWMFRRRPTAPA